MTKAERIIEVCRIHENGNMSKMAQKTGVTPAYISKLKNKPDSEPSDMFIRSVSKLYGVNEDWLQTGSGEPYTRRTNEELIAQFFGEVVEMDDSNLTKRFITMLAKMDSDQRKKLEALGELLLQLEKK